MNSSTGSQHEEAFTWQGTRREQACVGTSMTSARIISVKTPLPPDKLLIRSAIVTEQLGQPFEMQIELLGRDDGVDFDALLGRDITLTVKLAGGSVRYFHGVIAGFSQSGSLGGYVCYRARAVPWLWFLTRTADCCIFRRKMPRNPAAFRTFSRRSLAIKALLTQVRPHEALPSARLLRAVLRNRFQLRAAPDGGRRDLLLFHSHE